MANLAALLRLARAGWRLVRAGAFSLIDVEPLPAGPRMVVGLAQRFGPRDLSDGERAERLTRALNDLGPSYIKLGQFLATRADLVGKDAAATLGRLRDEIAAFPEEEARSVIARSLGQPVDVLFSSFSPAVAAASIAQVHKATITGAGGLQREVAVKVLRPGVRTRFRSDLETFVAGARLVERVDPQSRRLRPVVSVETLARSVAIEMDLRLEAAALSEMAELTAGDLGFRVPRVEWAHTARDVLTLEWIDGTRLSDVEGLLAAGHDLKVLARRLMQAFLRQALRDGFFHADLHQGNLFVDASGTIVAIDFGIMGRLGVKERRFLAEILYGFIRRDYRRVAEVHFEAGYVPSVHAIDDFAQALRAIGEPIHGQPASEISMARLLTLLFEITEIFDMETRPELILLQKTMVVVEGVSRSLDPEFDMWSASEPVIAEWVERNLGPVAYIERAAESFGTAARLAGELPRMVERVERISTDMASGGMRLHPDTVAEIGRAEARESRSGRVALWVMAAVAVLAGLKYLF